MGISEGVVPKLDNSRASFFCTNHAKSIGILWIYGIGLFEQDRPRLEMFEWSISQKDVGKKRRVIKSLLLVAVFTA